VLLSVLLNIIVRFLIITDNYKGEALYSWNEGTGKRDSSFIEELYFKRFKKKEERRDRRLADWKGD